MTDDQSNGYEAIADEFIAVRSTTGRALVQKWAASLPHGGSVIDIGAGSGEPLTSALLDEGLRVYAIDASETMVAEFQRRFPGVDVACESVEHSGFFNRTFDAAMAIGLMFLLPAASQRTVIRRISGVLKPGGSFLFSSPHQRCSWTDTLTGRPSVSLGSKEYRCLLAGCGLDVMGEHVDEGESHYFEALRRELY